MKIIYFFFSLFIMTQLISCADQEKRNQTAQQSGIDMDQFKWKNRIILSYPLNLEAEKEQQILMQTLKTEIKDRDLIILWVNKKEHSDLAFTDVERLKIIEKYKLIPGSHVLIGKDGGNKSKQIGKLDLKSFFDLIDKMPMRRSEMKAREN